jgi:non-heme chloroperoxidase
MNLLCFLIERPGRVAGLGLLGPFRTLVGNPALEELRLQLATTADAVSPELAREFQESTLARPIPSERLQSAVSESQKMPGRIWKALTRHLLDEDFSGDLARIGAPALVVWGERDVFTSRKEQERLVATLRNARLVTVPEAGHAMHWEDPAGTAAILAGFLAARIEAAA